MILDNLEEIITSIIKTKYDVDHINLVLTNRPDLCDYQINEVFIEICPCRSCGIADDRLWRQ